MERSAPAARKPSFSPARLRVAVALGLLVAACAAPLASDYVPEGSDLPVKVREAYRRALREQRRGDAKRALEILDDLAARHPLHLGLHLERLRLARRLEGPEAAARRYDPPPPGVGPDRAGILAGLARLPEDELAKRRSLLEFALAREPKEPLWHLCLSDLELRAHDAVQARAKRERELGKVTEAAGSFQEAAQALDRARSEAEDAARLDPGLAEAYVLCGYAETRIADAAEGREKKDEWRERAEKQYRKAIDLDAGSVTARVDLAEDLLYFDRHEEAAQVLREAARLAPGEVQIWHNLGVTYYATGRVEEAVDAYRRVLALDPSSAEDRAGLADCLERESKLKDAVAQLLRARADAGRDKRLLAAIAFDLGSIHERLGEYRLAVEEYKRHIALNGSDAAKAASEIRRIYRHAYED